MSEPLLDAVSRLQEQLHTLQGQVIRQLAQETVMVLSLYLLLLVATVLIARMLRALWQWVLR
jgi:hypothetical protein